MSLSLLNKIADDKKNFIFIEKVRKLETKWLLNYENQFLKLNYAMWQKKIFFLANLICVLKLGIFFELFYTN